MSHIFISNHEAHEIIDGLEYAVDCAKAEAEFNKLYGSKRQSIEYRAAMRRQNRYRRVIAELKRRIEK